MIIGGIGAFALFIGTILFYLIENNRLRTLGLSSYWIIMNALPITSIALLIYLIYPRINSNEN